MASVDACTLTPMRHASRAGSAPRASTVRRQAAVHLRRAVLPPRVLEQHVRRAPRPSLGAHGSAPRGSGGAARRSCTSNTGWKATDSAPGSRIRSMQRGLRQRLPRPGRRPMRARLGSGWGLREHRVGAAAPRLRLRLLVQVRAQQDDARPGVRAADLLQHGQAFPAAPARQAQVQDGQVVAAELRRGPPPPRPRGDVGRVPELPEVAGHGSGDGGSSSTRSTRGGRTAAAACIRRRLSATGLPGSSRIRVRRHPLERKGLTPGPCVRCITGGGGARPGSRTGNPDGRARSARRAGHHDPVLADALVERAAREAEDLGGARHHAPARAQHRLDVVALRLLQRERRDRPAAARRRARGRRDTSSGSSTARAERSTACSSTLRSWRTLPGHGMRRGRARRRPRAAARAAPARAPTRSSSARARSSTSPPRSRSGGTTSVTALMR